MTRYLILIALTSAVALSCTNRSAKEKLIGTWKLTDMPFAGDSVIGTATFTKQNELMLKTIINGKVADSRNCTYELSADNEFLTTKIDTSTVKFEIMELTKDVLELKEINKMKIAHYVRYDN